MQRESLLHAIEDWSRIVGEQHVSTLNSELQSASTATFATTQQVLAIVRPVSRDEVQACLRAANEHRTPIYATSRGKNWGLGSQVPPGGDRVLMDLSRMTRVTAFDEELGYITVEPGVTFQQVHDYLKERHSNLYLTVTGGPPDGSLIGNSLERGDGTGPYGERPNHVCELEVVLPTGQCVHTGFGRFGNASASPVTRWGVGPLLNGLFTQSNLGVVTRMTMWLAPRPPFAQAWWFAIRDTGQFEPLLVAARELMQYGLIRPHCFRLMNWRKYESIVGAHEASQLNIPGTQAGWFGCGELHSMNLQMAKAERQTLWERLQPHVDRFEFIDSPGMTPDQWLGVPTSRNLRCMYADKSTAAPSFADPGRDRCGVLWLCPVLPFKAASLREAIGVFERRAAEHGIDPQIGLSCPSGRSMHLFLSIIYDRNLDGADERAMACYDETLAELAGLGHLPYRLGIQSMKTLPTPDDDHGFIMKLLKQSLDPANVVAPGRYDFRETWPTDADGD